MIVLLVCCSCALPRSTIDTAGFVRPEELETTGLVREGMGFLSQSRYVDAELSFRRALYFSPDADNIRENLAAALMGSQQFNEVDQILAQLSARYPKAIRIVVSQAQSYFRQRRYQESEATFRRALDLAFQRQEFSQASSILRSLAFLANDRGYRSEALCYSAQAFALKPDTPEALSHARLLMQDAQYAKAVSTLAELNHAPADAQIELNRIMAMAAYGAQDLRVAAQAARRVLASSRSTDVRAAEAELILFLADKGA
ncbi:MAG: hypothetical protein EBZ48_12875, partial [Proteobacteria bacterium]|nr:hypothetical protein [Pseudomonadota bacterium]